MGLLGGDDDSTDPLASVGLGLGASERARELALKGMLYEIQQEIAALKAPQKVRRGAPKKAVSIDLKRALVIYALKVALLKRYEISLTQKKLITLAQSIEKKGLFIIPRTERIWGQREENQRLENSVSKGLREMFERPDVALGLGSIRLKDELVVFLDAKVTNKSPPFNRD